MKIVTIGLSPFVLTSRGKLHSWILQYLYLHGSSVASICWGHDKSFFLPKSVNNEDKYYYDFNHGGKKHDIQIFPFDRNGNESIEVYEVLKRLNPDCVILIGDITDFLFMHAIKSFYSDFMTIFVLMGYSCPINEHHVDLLNDFDQILCTSQQSYDYVKSICNTNIDFEYVYCNKKIYNNYRAYTQSSKIKIMSVVHNVQSDNVATIIKTCSKFKDLCDLYLHINMYDAGDYDLEILKNRFDPDGQFLKFPEKYVSLIDGISDLELADFYNNSDIYLHVPMSSATSMSVFQAVSCGCLPILSNVGCNINFAEMIGQIGVNKDNILINCIELMTKGENYLHICDPSDLEKKIGFWCNNIKKHKGLRNELSQFMNHGHTAFLKKIADMVVNKKNNSLFLETV